MQPGGAAINFVHTGKDHVFSHGIAKQHLYLSPPDIPNSGIVNIILFYSHHFLHFVYHIHTIFTGMHFRLEFGHATTASLKKVIYTIFPREYHWRNAFCKEIATNNLRII